jgi:uncharacterized OsmC-like protein
MVKISISYCGGLRCEATHGPSGCRITTDAPVDNHGKGESFSPTDLLATALGSCMATVMGIVAQKHGVELVGMEITVEKEMVLQPVRRVGRLITRIRMPIGGDHPQRRLFEQAAFTCPVHASLHPAVDIPVEFLWGLDGPGAGEI